MVVVLLWLTASQKIEKCILPPAPPPTGRSVVVSQLRFGQSEIPCHYNASLYLFFIYYYIRPRERRNLLEGPKLCHDFLQWKEK